jgi:protein archease
MTYRLIDHTADFGLLISGRHEKGLFSNAGMALMDQLTELDRLRGEESHELKVAGLDLPDLMVNWLREILYFWSGRQKLVKAIEIRSLSPEFLHAQLAVDTYDPDVHVIKREIKAVTYHQIDVRQKGEDWEAKIIFDV